jgi:transcriptional regulator with XRE-family HTH domain
MRRIKCAPCPIVGMPEDVRRLVGGNVRRLRLAAGLSQAALSERMGVDRAYVSGLERGERNPTIVTLWHTAEALRVKVRALFEKPRGIRNRPI